MLGFTGTLKVFLATQPAAMHKGLSAPYALTLNQLKEHTTREWRVVCFHQPRPDAYGPGSNSTDVKCAQFGRVQRLHPARAPARVGQ